MARLLLVRHGKTEGEVSRYYGHINIWLSREGIKQAELLRERLASESLDAIYSSDLERAISTAEIIAVAHKLKVIPCPHLRELDFGKLVPFNCVHMSFQTKEHAADSFRIKVWGNNQWQTAVEVAGNTQRRRVICFDRKTSSKLRLVLAKGRDNMAVCEIRVYDEAVE